jgi:hypothetical protein
MLIDVPLNEEVTIDVKGGTFDLHHTDLADDLMICIENEPIFQCQVDAMAKWIYWASCAPLKKIIPMPFGSSCYLWAANTGDPGWCFGMTHAKYCVKSAIKLCNLTDREYSDAEIHFCAHELLKICDRLAKEDRFCHDISRTGFYDMDFRRRM